ncbi:MAG: hypothetical protein M3016_10500 [Actinomycetota bacterium]|nr:hypothetical protein [Actinomycetota bacterium]
MPTPLPRARASLLTLLAVAAVGCGNTVAVGRSGALQVAVTEYHVAPQSVRARAGTLSIFVHNYGRLSHNLVISRAGHPQASTQPIPPGQTTELIATLTPGQYLISSTILSDQALGTFGTLTVT